MRAAGIHTTVASVHISNERRAEGVKVGNHLGVLTHLVELGNSQIGLAKTGSSGAGTSLRMLVCVEMLATEAGDDQHVATYHVHGVEASLNGGTG